MATGKAIEAVDPSTLPVGTVVTNSGRVSAAKMYEPQAPELPFTPAQLAQLDEALTLSSRTTGLDFSVYLGELGSNARERAQELHGSTESPSHHVLVAVSPGERVVEIVTGEESHRRLADRGAKLAVMSMVASFKEGDLAGGLVSGLRMLTDQAGNLPRS
ncbi:TLP18.3, Psb32 and MOLO-1 founding protein of phosphatase [Lentzea albidocapillata subsp. violacea]|uniref:TLP18.3, Psb32 and MOLO-1 founding protein of phosphatase n=1 Tax=Lentzea albidocapillata subsp. violacea TaxID=128104 RepID=A0A1G9NRV2_9PSEU|nr:DUF5130 family protein [Lentzea albidocapillata]SDL88715.1 TLP18.3, Psb32 and MOLO-1 founding protein of phosphatase [Lentzea albidocapillata subsp. violacea]